MAVDPWSVAEADFPIHGKAPEILAFLVRYAVLAPSSHNTQPWRFRPAGDAVELHADLSRKLEVADPDGRELVISCGAALCHLRLAMRYFGYADLVEVLPQPELLARVWLGAPAAATAEEERMFRAIPHRRTYRREFEARPLPAALLAALESAAREEGACLHILASEEARHELGELIAEADRAQMADEAFRRELARWIHPHDSVTHDGMPGYAFGLPERMDFVTPWFARTIQAFDMGARVAALDRKLAAASPGLAVLGTAGDAPRDWLAAGQAIDRVLLRAWAEGVGASFFNQPVQVASLRPALRELMHGAGFPQMILRLGYAHETPPTPRRPASEVLAGH